MVSVASRIDLVRIGDGENSLLLIPFYLSRLYADIPSGGNHYNGRENRKNDITNLKSGKEQNSRKDRKISYRLPGVRLQHNKCERAGKDRPADQHLFKS